MNTGRTRFKKGHKHSAKWYEVRKTMIPWCKGKKMTEEQKIKLRGHKKPNATGEKNHSWKGGIASERGKFLKIIQKLVLKRDDYTCQLCGERGGILQVDHIQPWADFIDGRFDMNNCRTLCQKCHYQITFRKPMPASVKYWGYNKYDSISQRIR